MAAHLAQDSVEHQMIITGLNAQLIRVQREENGLLIELTVARGEQRTTELFDRITDLRATENTLRRQKEVCQTQPDIVPAGTDHSRMRLLLSFTSYSALKPEIPDCLLYRPMYLCLPCCPRRI